jgi:hypothetical protein
LNIQILVADRASLWFRSALCESGRLQFCCISQIRECRIDFEDLSLRYDVMKDGCEMSSGRCMVKKEQGVEIGQGRLVPMMEQE